MSAWSWSSHEKLCLELSPRCLGGFFDGDCSNSRSHAARPPLYRARPHAARPLSCLPAWRPTRHAPSPSAAGWAPRDSLSPHLLGAWAAPRALASSAGRLVLLRARNSGKGSRLQAHAPTRQRALRAPALSPSPVGVLRFGQRVSRQYSIFIHENMRYIHVYITILNLVGFTGSAPGAPRP